MGSQPINTIDRALLRTRLRRAAVRRHRGSEFLLSRVGGDLAERLALGGERFERAVVLEDVHGSARAMVESTGKIDWVLELAADPSVATVRTGAVADAEWLPLGHQSVDLIVSNLTLHYVNDLPGALVQIRRTLRPGGLFLGAMLGGETLTELRQALGAAESQVRGGVSPRVLPFADIRDLGDLLQRAGFAMPVTDRDRLTVRYRNPAALIEDLRALGASNPLTARERHFAQRRLFLRAWEAYCCRFGDGCGEGEADGRVPATFDIMTLSGRAPDRNEVRVRKPEDGAP